MKKLLVFLILATLTNTARALEPREGWLIDIAAGYTPSILSINSGISREAYLGYKFNQIFSIEGGYTYLLTGASSGAATTVNLGGPELAGLIRFRLNDRVSPFLRVGYTKMAEKQIVGGSVTSIENLIGPSYGGCIQFYETDHLSLRLGYNVYTLQTTSDYNMQAGIPINTSNAYAALVIQF